MYRKLSLAIHDLIYNNIYCSDPNSSKWAGIASNGYERRIIGFRAEIEFKLALRTPSVLDGGWMISTQNGRRCLEHSVYFTISRDNPDRYVSLYTTLGGLGFVRLFFVQYTFPDITENLTGWNVSDIMNIGVGIPHPDYRCYEFQNNRFMDISSGRYNLEPLVGMYGEKNRGRKASYRLCQNPPLFIEQTLGHLPAENLADILSNRFVFDGLIGFSKIKGIPSDIDLIIQKEKSFLFLEIKEKDRSKTPPAGFGMDIPRMNDMVALSGRLGCRYLYVVKEVNNQMERRFQNWWVIDIGDFKMATSSRNAVEGGTGMATATVSGHPTLVAPIEKFTRMDAVDPMLSRNAFSINSSLFLRQWPCPEPAAQRFRSAYTVLSLLPLKTYVSGKL